MIRPKKRKPIEKLLSAFQGLQVSHARSVALKSDDVGSAADFVPPFLAAENATCAPQQNRNQHLRTTSMFTFNKNYFGLAILIFCVEVLIALFVHDNFIRPYIGDVLVVVLIYCFLKSFLQLPVFTAAIIVLLFSFTVEFLQLVHIVKQLGLEKSKIARIMIGTSFSWLDLFSYAAGTAIVMVVEKYGLKKK